MTYRSATLGTAPAPAAGGGGSSTAGAIANAVSSGFNFAGTLASIANGDKQSAERASRRELEGSKNALEIARLQAGSAGANAAAALEAARIDAAARAKTSQNTVVLALVGVGALAVLGIGAAVVLKPSKSAPAAAAK